MWKKKQAKNNCCQNCKEMLVTTISNILIISICHVTNVLQLFPPNALAVTGLTMSFLEGTNFNHTTRN